MTASFSELEFHQKLRENNQQFFLKMVASYEKTIAASMRAQGFKRINQKERTVTFSFGTMTFSRSRWKKGDTIRVPLDEKLGLIPRQRFSQEFLYLVTILASFMPYRKVVEVFDFRLFYIHVHAAQRVNGIRQGAKTNRHKVRYVQIQIHIQHPKCLLRTAV